MGAGLAVAPALRTLGMPLLGATIFILGRAWYLEESHRRPGIWRARSRWVLIASTVLVVALWVLRFVGLLGMRPWPFPP